MQTRPGAIASSQLAAELRRLKPHSHVLRFFGLAPPINLECVRTRPAVVTVVGAPPASSARALEISRRPLTFGACFTEIDRVALQGLRGWLEHNGARR